MVNIEIIDVSKMKQPVIKRYDIKESPGEKCQIKKVPLEIISKNMISCEEISCERTKLGMTDNCTICENKNSDLFIRCRTKYK